MYKPLDTIYTDEWYMISDKHTPVDEPVFTDAAKTAIQKVYRLRPDGRLDHRIAIWYRDKIRNKYTNPEIFDMVPAPWLTIECDGEDMTETLSPYVCKGNLITFDFLQSIQKGKWTYMDPKTFGEFDFPSIGLVINA